MIGKNFKYKGFPIPYTKQEGIDNGWYADILWKTVTTDTVIINRQDFHGVQASPTLARGRIITISGEIFSTSKTARGLARNIIDSLFTLEQSPNGLGVLHALEFEDDDGTEWSILCQVYSLPDYISERGSPIITFTLQLLAPDPLTYATSIESISGVQGIYTGVQLPVTLPIQFLGIIGKESTVNIGNFASPTKITIGGNIVNPKIINLTTGNFWRHERTLSGSDQLIIDTRNTEVTFNGVSDMQNRGDGSNWMYANSGTNYFLLVGDGYNLDNPDRGTFSIEYNPTMI